MDQEPSNEKVQSNDCLISLSDGNTDYAEKFVQPSKIHALNIRTTHCIICCYYTTYDDTSALCVAYRIYLRNIGVKGMYLIRKHKDCSFHTLDSRWLCLECGADVHYIPVQHMSTLRTLKNY